MQRGTTLPARAVLGAAWLARPAAAAGLSKLFLTIAAASAEAERDRIRERVAQVKRDQRQARTLPRRQGALRLPGGRGGGLGGRPGTAGGHPRRAGELRAVGAPLRTIRAMLEAELGARVSPDALARVVREAAA